MSGQVSDALMNLSSPGRSSAEVVGVTALRGQAASLHTDRYIAAKSPSENRWLSPSFDVICASTMLNSRRRPAGNHRWPAGRRKSPGVSGDDARGTLEP